jgi:hypothetical protein
MGMKRLWEKSMYEQRKMQGIPLYFLVNNIAIEVVM